MVISGLIQFPPQRWTSLRPVEDHCHRLSHHGRYQPHHLGLGVTLFLLTAFDIYLQRTDYWMCIRSCTPPLLYPCRFRSLVDVQWWTRVLLVYIVDWTAMSKVRKISYTKIFHVESLPFVGENFAHGNFRNISKSGSQKFDHDFYTKRHSEFSPHVLFTPKRFMLEFSKILTLSATCGHWSTCSEVLF